MMIIPMSVWHCNITNVFSCSLMQTRFPEVQKYLISDCMISTLCMFTGARSFSQMGPIFPHIVYSLPLLYAGDWPCFQTGKICPTFSTWVQFVTCFPGNSIPHSLLHTVSPQSVFPGIMSDLKAEKPFHYYLCKVSLCVCQFPFI